MCTPSYKVNVMSMRIERDYTALAQRIANILRDRGRRFRCFGNFSRVGPYSGHDPFTLPDLYFSWINGI